MKYAVFFKGLNVGGKNMVAMDKLRQMLIDLGFSGARTYIQSGNAVFESELDERASLGTIRAGFSARFGFDGGPVLRSADELRILSEKLPFTPEEIAAAETADPKVEHLYVLFLNSPPQPGQIGTVLRDCDESDCLRVGERELYLLFRQSIRKSRLAARAAKVFDSATIRNWKTVRKMCRLLTEA